MSESLRKGRAQANVCAKVLTVEDAAPFWGQLTESDPFGVAQMLPWVRNWRDCVNPDVFVALLHDGDRTILLLPLEIVRARAAVTARYIGGSHANANFPAMSASAKDFCGAVEIGKLFAAIRRERPQIDALILTRQLECLAGFTNPLLAMGAAESPNLALSFELGPDFEILAKARGWSRKQKKMRNQSRRLKDRGGWECVKGESAASALKLMDRFFILKAARFNEFGQRDTFEPQGIQDFFRKVFTESAQSVSPFFQLDGLSVNGELLAVAGSVIKHGGVTVEFGAVDASEISLSPGDFLFHQMISRSCSDGHKNFSFGVGDEPYKRTWCDIETRHWDSVHAFTLKGQLAVAVFRLAAATKRAVKRNSFLFGLLKSWRAHRAERPSSGEGE